MKREILLSVFLIMSLFLFSQDYTIQKDGEKTISPFSIQASLGANLGFNSFPTGIVTTTGDDVMIAGGSGGPLSLGLGYTIKNRLEVNGSFMIISTGPNITNASVSMDRTAYQVCIKYKINSNPKKGWLIGIGANYMTNIKLDIDASKLINGEHLVLDYKDSFSPVILLSYQYNFSSKVGFIVDFPLQFNSYTLDKFSANNVNIPLYMLNSQANANFKKIDAAGLGFWFGFVVHI